MSKIDFVMRDRAGYLPWTCQDWFTNYDDRGCCWYMGNKILWIILKLKNELSIVNLKWRSIILTSIVLNEFIKNFRTGTIPFGISSSAFWKTNNFIFKKNHVFFSLKKNKTKISLSEINISHRRTLLLLLVTKQDWQLFWGVQYFKSLFYLYKSEKKKTDPLSKALQIKRTRISSGRDCE